MPTLGQFCLITYSFSAFILCRFPLHRFLFAPCCRSYFKSNKLQKFKYAGFGFDFVGHRRADAQEARLVVAQRFHGFLPDDWLGATISSPHVQRVQHETCFAGENKHQVFHTKYSTVVDRQFVRRTEDEVCLKDKRSNYHRTFDFSGASLRLGKFPSPNFLLYTIQYTGNFAIPTNTFFTAGRRRGLCYLTAPACFSNSAIATWFFI